MQSFFKVIGLQHQSLKFTKVENSPPIPEVLSNLNKSKAVTFFLFLSPVAFIQQCNKDRKVGRERGDAAKCYTSRDSNLPPAVMWASAFVHIASVQPFELSSVPKMSHFSSTTLKFESNQVYSIQKSRRLLADAQFLTKTTSF